MTKELSPIEPAVMRMVLVRGTEVNEDFPTHQYPAIITRVWSHNVVNLHVFNDKPGGKNLFSVQYKEHGQEAEGVIPGSVWSWNEHQVRVAKAQSREPQGAQRPSVVERVEAEHFELNKKFEALGMFLGTQEFRDLEGRQREMLIRQHECMREYVVILRQRLAIMKG